VAVVVLSRATAPWRRWTGGPSRRGRNAPSASRSRGAAARRSPVAGGPPGKRASHRGVGRARCRQDGEGRWGGSSRPGTSRLREDRDAARAPATTGARIGPPSGPRTSRRCCPPRGQWYRVKPPLQVTIEGSWQPPVSGRPGLRPGRSRVRPRPRTGRARRGRARGGQRGGPQGCPGRRGSSAR
jgi:hypothetical protein